MLYGCICILMDTFELILDKATLAKDVFFLVCDYLITIRCVTRVWPTLQSAFV